MNRGEFSDAAVILFGHGTTLNAESGASVLQHVAELRRRHIFAAVHEAFWKQEPRLLDVASQVRQERVFLVPFFISEGYFSEQIIPAALGFQVLEGRVVNRVLTCDKQVRFYCHPAGTHPTMTDVLLDRARAIVRQFPFPHLPEAAQTTLFIAGHGTEQNVNSRQAVERQAEFIRQLGLYAAVNAVYLEEEPRVDACYQLAQTRNIVVVPLFIGDGLHVQEDIPVLLGEHRDNVRARFARRTWPWRNPTEKHGRLVWYAPSVGTDPLMAEVILARVKEAAGTG